MECLYLMTPLHLLNGSDRNCRDIDKVFFEACTVLVGRKAFWASNEVNVQINEGLANDFAPLTV